MSFVSVDQAEASIQSSSGDMLKRLTGINQGLSDVISSLVAHYETLTGLHPMEPTNEKSPTLSTRAGILGELDEEITRVNYALSAFRQLADKYTKL